VGSELESGQKGTWSAKSGYMLTPPLNIFGGKRVNTFHGKCNEYPQADWWKDNSLSRILRGLFHRGGVGKFKTRGQGDWGTPIMSQPIAGSRKEMNSRAGLPKTYGGGVSHALGKVSDTAGATKKGV